MTRSLQIIRLCPTLPQISGDILGTRTSIFFHLACVVAQPSYVTLLLDFSLRDGIERLSFVQMPQFSQLLA